MTLNSQQYVQNVAWLQYLFNSFVVLINITHVQ